MDASRGLSRTRPAEILRSKLMMVEGEEEVKFFTALSKHLGITDVQVESYNGKGNLSSTLKALPKRSGFGRVVSLGIERDADDHPDRASQSVITALRNAGLPVPPSELDPVDGPPCVAFLIMPGNGRRGALEDLCLEAVAADPGMNCVNAFFDCLDTAGCAQPGSMPKARVHAFLASREAPDLRLGEAAAKGYWPWENGSLDHVKQFLQLVAKQG